MPFVTYIEHNGTEHRVAVPNGETVMRGAVLNDIPGIDADCGGVCACATCHVFVGEKFLSLLPPASEMEESMMSFASEIAPNSRLSCQITVSDALDGLIVRMPGSQH